MTIDQFMVFCLVGLLLWFVYIGVTIYRNEKLAKRTLTRIEEQPQDIDRAQLMDQERLYLTVRFRGEEDVMLSVHGLAAVRLFDKIGVIAPQAVCTVTRGGKPVTA